MNTATGIHISGDSLRVVCVEKSDDAYYLRGLLTQRVSASWAFDTEVPEPFVNALRAALDRLPAPLGPLSFALSDGLYHIQKVPLEVASKKDRREQIAWEAAQTLISPLDEFEIDFMPAGRAAFWTAVRKGVISAHEALGHALGNPRVHLIAAPLALFYAGRIAGIWRPGPQVVVRRDSANSFCIAVKNGVLTAVAAHARPACNRVYLSADKPHIASSAERDVVAYPTFCGINTSLLPRGDRAELEHPGKFALALGAVAHDLSPL